MIKKLLILGLAACAPFAARAEALFDKPVEAGWHVAPQIKLSQINGKFAILLGGDAAILADGQWGLGLGGYGLVTKHEFNGASSNNTRRRLALGYTGPKITFIPAPSYLVHVEFGLLLGIGFGEIGTRDTIGANMGEWIYDGDPLFMVEPEVGVELNIVEGLRLGASASYRMAAGFESRQTISSSDFSGPTATIWLKFGKIAPKPTTGWPWW